METQKTPAGVRATGTQTVTKDGQITDEKPVGAAEHANEAELLRIAYGKGMTLNLGNYQSARIEVRIEVPCRAKNLDRALAWTIAKVEKTLQDEINKMA